MISINLVVGRNHVVSQAGTRQHPGEEPEAAGQGICVLGDVEMAKFSRKLALWAATSHDVPRNLVFSPGIWIFFTGPVQNNFISPGWCISPDQIVRSEKKFGMSSSSQPHCAVVFLG